MQRIRTLSGAGAVELDDNRSVTVKYDIDIWQEASGIKQGRGSLVGSFDLLKAAHEGARVLKLQNGQTVEIVITNAQFESDGCYCSISTSGPVPAG